MDWTVDIYWECNIFSYMASQQEWKATTAYVTVVKSLGLTVWTQRICACSSVIYCDVTEQVSHGLSIVDASDGLGQDHTDVHCLDLGTLELLDLVRDCISHHHLGGDKDTKWRARVQQDLCLRMSFEWLENSNVFAEFEYALHITVFGYRCVYLSF